MQITLSKKIKGNIFLLDYLGRVNLFTGINLYTYVDNYVDNLYRPIVHSPSPPPLPSR